MLGSTLKFTTLHLRQRDLSFFMSAPDAKSESRDCADYQGETGGTPVRSQATRANPSWTEDETILALDVLLGHWPKVPDKGHLATLELSSLLRSLPIHPNAVRSSTFRNPNGIAMTLQNLASLHRERSDRPRRNVSRLDQVVWHRFAGAPDALRAAANEIRAGAILLLSDTSNRTSIDAGVQEGAVLERVHRFRERQSGLRAQLLVRVNRVHGVLLCEACKWTLPSTWDEKSIGADLIASVLDSHHLVPLASTGTTLTRLDDLALLCANCHRLIHAVMRAERRHFSLADFVEWQKSLRKSIPY